MLVLRSSAIAWEKLVSDFEVSEDGKLSVYIDNSSSDKVYFDEFIIERTEATVAVVVQENHYYPFGMNMKGIEELDLQSLGNTDEYRFQYNGKEKEEAFGLYWTDYGWRTYDMQLGRWHGVDNLAEKYQSLSSYTYVANNPLKYIDPDGQQIDFSELIKTEEGKKVADRIITDLSKITGAKISYNKKGILEIDKSKVEGGSESALKFVSAIISDSEQDIKISLNTKKATGVGKDETTISFNSDEIDKSINSLKNKSEDAESGDKVSLDPLTDGYGMGFLHETLHTKSGAKAAGTGTFFFNHQSDDSGDEDKTGNAVNFINSFRRELGLPTRETYLPYPRRWSDYFRRDAIIYKNKGRKVYTYIN